MALAAAATATRDQATERCAETVVAKLHPKIGMADMTGVYFEWLQISGIEPDLTIIGSIVEPDGNARVAHRFICRMRGKKSPRVEIGKLIRL